MQADSIPRKRSSERCNGQAVRSDCSGLAGIVEGGDEDGRSCWRGCVLRSGMAGKECKMGRNVRRERDRMK